VEVSVVIPCLDEADTLETCVRKAQRAMDEHGIDGEVVVADNGSTDDSVAIAERCGARVVHVPEPGYGSALMGGIEAARGRYVVMGDADDSYDWLELPRFVGPLREGFDVVQGCRLPSGGGTVLPGAMPWLHRHLGNPLFSRLARRWFHAPIHDVYCGMRGFTKAWYDRLGLRCTGMEFATEMMLKSSLLGARIAEVPITLHPDGRVSHPPHLNTFRDGWRTLRFFLIYSPRRTFLLPGVALVALGLLAFALALARVELAGVSFDAHTLVFGALAILCGYQSLLLGLFTKVFAVEEGLLPVDRRVTRFTGAVTLDRGLLLGAGALAAGLVLLAVLVVGWAADGFGDLVYADTMRLAVPGLVLTALGFMTIGASFFLGVLGLRLRGQGAAAAAPEPLAAQGQRTDTP
jgi:glycosyltransferase involved in cell wall biosynthesis